MRCFLPATSRTARRSRRRASTGPGCWKSRVADVIGDTAFVHAGLPPLVAELGLDGHERAHARASSRSTCGPGRHRKPSCGSAPDRLPRAGGRTRPSARPSRASRGDIAGGARSSTPPDPPGIAARRCVIRTRKTDNLAAASKTLSVERVVVGHTVTPTGRVASRFDGRVILLDTGMLGPAYQGSPAALVFERGQWSVA